MPQVANLLVYGERYRVGGDIAQLICGSRRGIRRESFVQHRLMGARAEIVVNMILTGHETQHLKQKRSDLNYLSPYHSSVPPEIRMGFGKYRNDPLTVVCGLCLPDTCLNESGNAGNLLRRVITCRE